MMQAFSGERIVKEDPENVYLAPAGTRRRRRQELDR
jgi:hypothetical protein